MNNWNHRRQKHRYWCRAGQFMNGKTGNPLGGPGNCQGYRGRAARGSAESPGRILESTGHGPLKTSAITATRTELRPAVLLIICHLPQVPYRRPAPPGHWWGHRSGPGKGYSPGQVRAPDSEDLNTRRGNVNSHKSPRSYLEFTILWLCLKNDFSILHLVSFLGPLSKVPQAAVCSQNAPESPQAEGQWAAWCGEKGQNL